MHVLSPIYFQKEIITMGQKNIEILVIHGISE